MKTALWIVIVLNVIWLAFNLYSAVTIFDAMALGSELDNLAALIFGTMLTSLIPPISFIILSIVGLKLVKRSDKST